MENLSRHFETGHQPEVGDEAENLEVLRMEREARDRVDALQPLEFATQRTVQEAVQSARESGKLDRETDAALRALVEEASRLQDEYAAVVAAMEELRNRVADALPDAQQTN